METYQYTDQSDALRNVSSIFNWISTATTMVDSQLYVIQDNYAYAFDPKSKLWTRLADLKIKRDGSPQLVSIGNMLYAIGGSESHKTAVESYSILNNTWTIVQSTKFERKIVAVANGLIFAMGGWPPTNTIEAYNATKNEWFDVPGLVPSQLTSSLVFVIQDSIYVYYTPVLVYDSKANTWSSHPELDGTCLNTDTGHVVIYN